MRTLLAGAALVAAVTAIAPITSAGPTSRAILTGCDALVPTGVPTTVRVKVERDNYSRYDLKNVKVEFWANGSLLGTALSGYDGYAKLGVSAPSSAGDLLITGKLAAGGSYTAGDTTLLLCARDKATRIVVTDVDSTISAASWSNVTKKSNDQLAPLAGAVRGISDLAKDATIVYLTAREDDYRSKTKDWLDRWGFPRGPVFCSDSDKGSTDPHTYKSRVLYALAPYFPNMKAGIGNKASDAQAYHDNGMASALFDTQGGPFPSYALVTDGWDELRSANAAGKVPFLSWASSFR